MTAMHLQLQVLRRSYGIPGSENLVAKTSNGSKCFEQRLVLDVWINDVFIPTLMRWGYQIPSSTSGYLCKTLRRTSEWRLLTLPCRGAYWTHPCQVSAWKLENTIHLFFCEGSVPCSFPLKRKNAEYPGLSNSRFSNLSSSRHIWQDWHLFCYAAVSSNNVTPCQACQPKMCRIKKT